MQTVTNDWRRRCRVGVSALVVASLIGPPALAQKGDATLNACSAERAPLVKLDQDYEQIKRSKTAKAVGEGIKQGAMVLAKGVMSGGIPIGRGGGGGFGGGFGGVGGLMGAVGGMAASQAAAQQARQAGVQPAAAPTAGMIFGQDMLSGAMGLSVPGLDGGYGGVGISGGGDMKAYAALAVLVAIVATAEAYAQLKEQEAGGDLKKASFNIDQDAGRQVAVARQIADSGAALVECRSRQLNDINTRLASASNDKDRKAIRRERTQLTSALNKDIDLTGDVVGQHVGMAKTFTQGRAMTDGASEAEVLGNQAPAYAPAASTAKLAMPKPGQSAPTQTAAAAPPPPPPQALVALRPATVRSAPSSTASALMSLPVGREITPKGRAANDNTWWEVDVAGQPGYIRVTELGDRSMLPAQAAAPAGKGQAGARGRAGARQAAAPPPPPPAVQGPSNIRAYNGQVIAAKTNGKDRLSALMTDIQAAQRRESVFYAMLERIGLG